MKLILGLIGLWVLFSLRGDLHSLYLPEFMGVISSLKVELQSGDLLSNLAATAMRVLTGLIAGVFFGVILGAVLGFSERAKKEGLPLVEIFRGIPTSMLFPVFIVALGIGEVSKTVIVASATFPIMVINTMTGMAPRNSTIDRTHYITLHGQSIPWKMKAMSKLWDAIPSMIAGLKVSISIALVLTIVTEMFFIASSGVGWAAHQSYLAFDLDTMYFYIITVGLVGLLINVVFDFLVRKVSKII